MQVLNLVQNGLKKVLKILLVQTCRNLGWSNATCWICLWYGMTDVRPNLHVTAGTLLLGIRASGHSTRVHYSISPLWQSPALTRMNRYLSGGGSLVEKMEVSLWSILSMARAAGALRMRSCEAPADTVSSDSASAIKPRKEDKPFLVTLCVCRRENQPHIFVRCYLSSPGLSAICLWLLDVCLSWPQCRHSGGDSPEEEKEKAFMSNFLSGHCDFLLREEALLAHSLVIGWFSSLSCWLTVGLKSSS